MDKEEDKAIEMVLKTSELVFQQDDYDGYHWIDLGNAWARGTDDEGNYILKPKPKTKLYKFLKDRFEKIEMMKKAGL